MPHPRAERPLSEQAIKVYVPADVGRQVDAAAARSGETRSGWLRRLIVASVASEPESPVPS